MSFQTHKTFHLVWNSIFNKPEWFVSIHWQFQVTKVIVKQASMFTIVDVLYVCVDHCLGVNKSKKINQFII